MYDILYKIGFRHTIDINMNPTVDDLYININYSNADTNTNK